MRTQITLAAFALVGTFCVNAGFMGQAADQIFDESQKEFIDGVAVYPVNETSATSVSYYDWQHQIDWSQMGVQTYNYTQKQSCGGSYYASECPQQRYFRPCTQSCFPYCAPSCQYYVPTCTSYQNCTIPAPVVVNCTNTTNSTVPIIPQPSNSTVPNVTIVVTNCTMFKTCRQRPTCGSAEWWDYWNIDQSSAAAAQSAQYPTDAAVVVAPYYGYGGQAGGNFQCNSCGMCPGIACQQAACNTCTSAQKVIRRRICNATEDDTFDVGTFNSNSSYYGGCDCVVFTNCTNSTQTVPANQTTPVIPVPPIPPSGSSCNYTCEDIRDLHIVVQNLTQIIADQQNDIDMLIGKYQEIATNAASGSSSSCCSKVDAINQEISDLYNIVNNITLDATNDTLSTIQRDGLRLGNNWWIGEQGAYLFAIDITDSTWYRFDPMVNRTL